MLRSRFSIVLACCLISVMFRLEGSYPKNQRRPYVRELNPHIYRYFFSVAAMSEYLGVSRQALTKRISRMSVEDLVGYFVKKPRFEGRRTVRRKIFYYEWRILYRLACCYDTVEAKYICRVFEPHKVLRDFHTAVEDDCLFVAMKFVG